MNQPIKRLYRTRDGVIAGLCDGLGHYIRVDPVVLRLILLAVTFLTGIVPGVLTYVAAWIIVPAEPIAIPVRPQAPRSDGGNQPA